MKHKTKLTLSLALITVLGVGFSGCSGGGSSSSATTEGSKSVTVERGKVFGARVVDSSIPLQTATSTLNSNIYIFAREITYPVRVSGGYIDVNGDGIITQDDIALDMNMSGYSNVVTPVSTYLALENNATLREERLNGLTTLLLELDANVTVTSGDLLELPSKAKDEVALVNNAIFAKYEYTDDSFETLSKVSIKSQYIALLTLLEQSDIKIGDEDFAKKAEAAVMLNLASGSYVEHPTLEAITNYEEGYESEQDNNTTHSFTEGLSLDISNGITSNSIISLFKDNNISIEMFFTLGQSGTATVQYVENNQAIWQNTGYVYSVSENTISCTLPVGGGLDLGQIAAPTQVTLALSNSIVQAHVSASINGSQYTVFSAFGDSTTGETNTTADTWSATSLTAPVMNVKISSDGTTIAGGGMSDFSLYTYNVQTKATTSLATDVSGNLIMCLANNDKNRDTIQIDARSLSDSNHPIISM